MGSLSAGHRSIGPAEKPEDQKVMRFTAGGYQIRMTCYYDCPTWITTTFPLQSTLKKKTTGGTVAS